MRVEVIAFIVIVLVNFIVIAIWLELRLTIIIGLLACSSTKIDFLGVFGFAIIFIVFLIVIIEVVCLVIHSFCWIIRAMLIAIQYIFMHFQSFYFFLSFTI